MKNYLCKPRRSARRQPEKLPNFGQQPIARSALRRQALFAVPVPGSGRRHTQFSLRVTKVSQVFSEKSL
jgi:hypothetical protein